MFVEENIQLRILGILALLVPDPEKNTQNLIFFNVAKNKNKLNRNVKVLVRIRIQGKTDPQH